MRSPASDDRRWSRAIASMISAWCAVFSPAWQRSVPRTKRGRLREEGRHSSFLSARAGDLFQPAAIWTCPQSGSAAIWSRPLTRADEARLAQERQAEALAAATAEYRRLSPFATGDKLAVSGEVNWMIAAAINANPRWFWHGPDA